MGGAEVSREYTVVLSRTCNFKNRIEESSGCWGDRCIAEQRILKVYYLPKEAHVTVS